VARVSESALAEDNGLLRESLVNVLARDYSVEVVETAGDERDVPPAQTAETEG
jgi:hypothetical protein